MRIFAYDANAGEIEFYREFERDHPDVEVVEFFGYPTIDDFTDTHVDVVSTSGAPFGADLIEAAAKAGCRYVCARSIGYDNIDLEAAARCGMRVSNVTYSPHSVAESLHRHDAHGPAQDPAHAAPLRRPGLPHRRTRRR
ncbi:hypothetical protein H8R18_07490 [Nanchangia anserum]|uniref:hypothetical protein n=1 Tax=Nanchangia anserum TaxID=2692125 RepID=UPI001883464D|nr:hypothetical protein [Nanchangia anserum]QOX81574.1 hypothetical protein H8R18_07490 [Nanchangia anserum]